MQNTIYEKNEKGYILRQHTASATVIAVCIICFGLILPFEALGKWATDEPQTLNVWVIIGFFFACVAVAIAVLRTECGYMVVAEDGVYFHRPLARTKFIAWENMRDWGIAHQRTRYNRVCNLYFSTKILMPTRRGKNKKIPTNYKRAVSIAVKFEDLSSLQRIGVISFCRQHLRSDNQTEKKFVSMFTSDLAEDHLFS
ncbi:MAG: hypothetical protein IJY33_03455 [Oscillospiraceae bacterium]|nr:hypothetical protein [Oscillospiraceae bacterium]